MTKASTYLILMAFFITLEIYRIPIAGYNVTFHHIFLAGAWFWGILGVLQNRGQIRINKETRIALEILVVFAAYSFVSFLRNIDIMRSESKSMFLAELIGYMMVLAAPIFITQRRKFRWFVAAFCASGVFVYLGAFYHLFIWITQKAYVTGVPFWQTFSHSEHVIQYLQSPSEFAHFPRFRLPFSSPAGTGVFLSLSGIFLLAFLLQCVGNKRKRCWWVILLNVANVMCLLGTFARASWGIYAVGSLVVTWCFRKYKLVSIGRVATTYFIVAVFLLSAMSLIPVGNQFAHDITLRFSPRYTEQSNIGHMGGIHTHSTYFTILVNRGLLGLVLFLAFLFSLYRLLKKKIRMAWQREDTSMLVYGIALLGGFLGLIVGHFLYEISLDVVWVYYGLILVCGNLPISAEPLNGKLSAKYELKRTS